MIKISKKCFFVLFISVVLFSSVLAQKNSCQSCHEKLKIDVSKSLMKPHSTEERAVGILDKGQLTNYLGNYGVISHYLEYLNDAMHWPAAGNAQTQYCFGLGLVVAVKGNVMTSVLGAFAEKIDWSPKDGSRGEIFSGDVTAPPPDLTPFLPMSDNPETWPQGYKDEAGNWVSMPGERFWPGHYRIDIDPGSPTYGEELEGQFVSDRDVYCVFDDKNNTNPNGAVGIEVEQTAFSFGRPYAEDMLFFDYTIHNKSGNYLDSVYVGYYAVFRPDFDFMDYINIIDSNPTDEFSNGDFVYIWDINNTKEGAWEDDPSDMGMIGLNVLETPKNMGVTDFHFFNREVAPKVDEKMWAVITSNPDDPNLIIPEAFFHGEDRRIDDTHPDSLKKLFPEGAPINFYIMTGPFNLAPDEYVKSSMAIVMGSSGKVPDEPDTTDLMNNMRMVQQMYQRKFQGSGPPKTPVVKANAQDQQVRLVWDSAAELSVDVLTGKNDFEGYKIYRSTDQGKTWGTPLTDSYGNVIGYKPIKIFDKIDGIKGTDPAFNQSLGDDSGLQHSFYDYNLINGIEYWYCVAAYDEGNQNPDSLEQSYQSSLGRSVMETHTVSVIPGVLPQNYTPPDYSPVPGVDGSLPPIGGVCQAIVKVDIVQPEKITGDDYVITYTDSALEIVGNDTNYVDGFNLYRISKETGDSTEVLYRSAFSNDIGDNLPIVDGFRLTMINSLSGIEFIGWTNVSGDTSTFDWRTKQNPKYEGRPDVVAETIYTVDDFRITIDTTETGGLWAKWYDFFTGTDLDTTHHLPLKVEVITDPENPIDISENTWLIEFATAAPWEAYRKNYYSPLGWDLIPGGKAFTNASPGFYEKYPDILNVEKIDIDNATNDTTYSGLYLFTNNFPDAYVNAEGDSVFKTAIPPTHGDQFTIKTYKPFRKEIRYEFNTSKINYSSTKDIDLNKIRVVPDPYIVSNSWESSQFGKKLMFNHLPNECTISIYTVAGDHIITLEHNDNNGYQFWDMRTYNDQYVAYGLYVFVVTIPNGQKKVGKFLIIK